MVKSKKTVDISDAAELDSYNIRTDSLSKEHIPNKLESISHIEKIFYLTIILATIVVAIGTVFVKSQVLQAEDRLSGIQYDITNKKTRQDELDQQIQELLRSDRVQKIAEHESLTLNDKNIRKASK